MLSALYYPFSRCLDAAALKQLLLVFESVTFLDPVADDEHRLYLMEEMIDLEDRRYAKYREIHRSINTLREENAISIIAPHEIQKHREALACASAFCDLSDPLWLRVASSPGDFGMPHRRSEGGTAIWEVFKPKIPDEFIESLEADKDLRRHLLRYGTESSSWILSYEAGSAMCTSLHLAAAEQFALAPVTDSPMHHQLLLHKALRQHYGPQSDEVAVTQGVSDSLAQQTAFTLVQELLPQHLLREVTLESILVFRDQLKEQRQRLITDLRSRFASLKSELGPERLHQMQVDVVRSVAQEVRHFQNAVTGARDKVWPNLVASLNKSLATGGLAAVACNLIGGPGYILAASVVASGLSFLKGILDIRNELRDARRSASPSVAYLSRMIEVRK